MLEEKEVLSRVLTTGSSGMVGSYVDFGIKVDHRELDITDSKEAFRVLKKYNPQVILHLAAETDVDRCERDPSHAYLVNSIGTYNIALAAKNIGAKVVYISTGSVFDGEKKGSYTEKDEPNPQNYYGQSKYLGEIIVKELLDDYIIARASWIFGGGPNKDQKFVAKIINQIKDKNITEIKAVNDIKGSTTFAKDLVDAIKKLIVNDKKGVFHLVNEKPCTRYDITQQITRVLKTPKTITPVDSDFFNLEAKRIKNESMSSNISLMRSWKDALREYLEIEWIDYLSE